MADIMTKAVWVNDFRQGDATIFVGINSGTVVNVHPVLNEVLSSGITDTKLSNRFDDYLYYSA